MYSSERANKIVTKDIAYLSAGIQDDVKLVSVKYEKSPQENKFLEFRFEKDNRSFTATEWEPRKNDNMTEEDFQNKCDNQFSRIMQILKCFYPNDADRQFTGENFEQFAKWVVSMLEKADLNTLLRVKIVYNSNGYTSLPKYAKYTFIEPMSIVNEGKSVVVKLGIDMFERPIVANTEEANPNPIITTTTTVENKVSDLPF